MVSSPARIASLLSVFLVLLIAGNLCVDRLARNSIPRQLLRQISSTNTNVEVVALGDSMIRSGFDPHAFATGFQHSNVKSVMNGGLGATGPVPHLLLGRAAIARQAGLRRLIYGSTDFWLVESPHETWWTLFGNNSIVFYQEPEIAAPHYSDSFFEIWSFRAAGSIPIFRERGNLWKHVELFRRHLGGIGMPQIANNSFGRVRDFDLMVYQDCSSFERKADTLVDRRAPLTTPVYQLLAEARERAIDVTVVLMPRPKEYQLSLATKGWKRYVTHLHSLLEEQHARLIDASGWVTNRDSFIDALHLSPTGAVEFSRRLGLELQ